MLFTESEEACPHCWDESAMRLPASSVVNKDECAYCCRTCSMNEGIYVCMNCFTGICADHIMKHRSLSPTHTMFTLIKELPEKTDNEEVKSTSQLGVIKEKEYSYTVCCGACKLKLSSIPELAVDSYHGITQASLPGAQDAVSDTQNAGFLKPQCPHLVCLEQMTSPYPEGVFPSSESTCSVEQCDCKLNNWMCVTCGAVGCPRRESGGKGHALQHYQITGHPTVVKLGTITPDGADYYCYLCDDDVSDVHFVTHMRHFNIDVALSKKTAKTMGEIEYDYSMQWNFKQIMEDGAELVPLYGPGRTGIYNIGNTCYIASVLQCLMSLEAFRDAFYSSRSCLHQDHCWIDPYACRTCQTERIASGLLSGEFSKADEENKGISPRLFKKVYAANHPDFSTCLQQDAQEYCLYLLEEMKRHTKPVNQHLTSLNPTEIFEILMEQRLECTQCHRVRYTLNKEKCLSLPIPITNNVCMTSLTPEEKEAQIPCCSLEDCLQSMASPNMVECKCETCGGDVVCKITTRIHSFPDVLLVHLRRVNFDMKTFTTNKMDVYVDVPEKISLEAYRAHGLQNGEVEMPKDSSNIQNKSSEELDITDVDEIALATIMSMDIEPDIAKYALKQTNMNVERALDYIFSHPNIQHEASAAGAQHENPTDSSFPEAAVLRPSVATDGVPSYKLKAMISHMGADSKSGHYVCHVQDSDTSQWVLFNDEKVGVSRKPPFSLAMMYFYVRQ
ncbi:unnamed protein product [Phytomonas sp. EM1]|nr:unnamed protein product [Phytomonas sp. EM1]|eukprot:CCW59722.1 unnamed protein product [Phytomonas sp. isolate EM1]